MSTLSGTASKGEKTKPKFQSLDINSVFKSSRGENTEKPVQKTSSNYIKHGMQSLGKVPNARRPPANLPSLKSEHSGSEAAVPLVPPGATGWGKQGEGPPTPGQQQQSPQQVTQNGSVSNTPQTPQQNAANQAPQLTPHQQAIALPVTNTIPPQHKQQTPTAQSATTSGGEKLWSTVMARGNQDGHPPTYQSPQFQHEFPSLSAGDGGVQQGRSDAPYAGGLSLRPQTEGSWTQGGQRPGGGGGSQESLRPGSGAPGAPPQLQGLAGPPRPENFPPQMRGVMPPFMYKGSYPPDSQMGPPNQHHMPAPHQQPASNRRQNDNRPPRLADRDRDMPPTDEMSLRPIIREEELNKLDEISNDVGWAASDDIDYNQKLAFSDDESDTRQPKRDAKSSNQPHSQQHKSQNNRSDSERQTPPRNWNQQRNSNSRGRTSDEEDIWSKRMKQQNKEVNMAIQRAKQRKEEEEKRFNEEKQRAAKKLQELDEKMREKRDRDRESEVGTINPSTVPPKPINHVDIPLPDFQKDKDRDSRSKTPPESSSTKEDNRQDNNSFRQLTQIEGKNFPPRKQQQQQQQQQHHQQQTNKQDHRDQNGPNFSRQFQNDLPPRFLKNRNNSSSGSSHQQQYYESNNRWGSNQNSKSRSDAHSPEREHDDRRDYKRQVSEESYRSSHHSQDNYGKSPDNRHSDENLHRRDDDKWHKEKERERKHSDYDRPYDDRRSQEKMTERDRPQRPDRDSHGSHTSHGSHGSHSSSNRRSRDMELKESMGSWNEVMELAYEEKKLTYEDNRISYEEKREIRIKDEPINKRQVPLLVPGPITRDRVEAEDLNIEKKNLTPLKKGEPLSIKKQSDIRKAESNEKMGAWVDSLPAADEPEAKSEAKEQEKVTQDSKRQDDTSHHRVQQSRNQNRGYSSSKSWGTWGGKRSSRGHRSGGSGRDYYGHTTDSDETEGFSSMDSKDKRKPPAEKDDKNREKSATEQKRQPEHKRDGYIPKGEPSRHGRGGGGNFRGTRMGGLGKRIDGYGPPPSKSPFGNQGHEEKDKKVTNEETTTSSTDSAPVADKTKQNQEALAAGIFGKSRQEPIKEDKERFDSRKPEFNRNKSRNRDDRDPNSDNSDKNKSMSSSKPSQQHNRSGPPSRENNRGRNPPPPRMGDKRQESKKSDPKLEAQNILASAIADISLKNRDSEEKSDKNDLSGESDGFQEVKSKKTSSKDKKQDEVKKVPVKDEKKDVRVDIKKPGGSISKPPTVSEVTKNIPPLMATPVQPPTSMMQPSKGSPFNNSRSNDRTAKLPPRFAKQKMQKQAMQQQQQHMMGDDLNKLSQNVNPYGIKDPSQQGITQAPPCAWDKPLGSQLRSMEQPQQERSSPKPNMLGISMEGVKLDGTPGSVHGPSPNGDKMMGKSPQLSDKSLLDGATPPVNTIIFENTNFKSAPGSRSGPRPGVPVSKPSPKLEDSIDNTVFGKPINELLQQKSDGVGKNDSIQLPVYKENTSDMNLDFFGSDLTHLTDDKMPTKSLSSTVKSSTTVSSTICNADSLNMKIASVKKVWETSEQENDDNSGITFGAPVLDSSVFKNENQDDSHEGYSPGQNQNVSTSTNVCKVKPTQQVTGSTGQTMSSGPQTPSAVMAQAALMGIPLSPPPMAAAPLLGAGVGLGQQYTAAATGQHMGYQPSAHGPTGTGSAQYGISTIPSPPTVLYNSTQQLQAAAAQTAGLYGAFLPTADQGVLGGQGRSQFSQYPSYPSLGQPASSPYNTQSMYLQTAHPPPTAQAPPELYQNLNSYRLSATAPFGQSQQLNNPTTVLISSTSNSLMSASVKQSNQPISAIGTKAGGVGQAYQQQSQQGQQVYMAYDPAIQAAANYLPNANVLQRGPGAPVQNNVMPTLQPSSSYYSGNTGGQGYFQQPGSSTLQSATQMPQHQAGYGLQGNVFGAPSQSHSSTGLQDLFQGYNSHLFSTPMQMAAAISAQQYIKQHQQQQQAPNPQQNHYMKTVGSGQPQMGSDQQMNSAINANRPQQLKSPSSQEALSSVFNSAPQIPSPKSKPNNNKHNSQTSSPTSQRKYNFYQGVNQQNNIQQRYPTPIQRPVNFQQQSMNVMGQNNPSMNSQKHANKQNTGKPPNRQYYGGQSNPLSSTQSDKSEPPKVTDASAVKNVNLTSVDIKDSSNVKEDTATLKD